MKEVSATHRTRLQNRRNYTQFKYNINTDLGTEAVVAAIAKVTKGKLIPVMGVTMFLKERDDAKIRYNKEDEPCKAMVLCIWVPKPLEKLLKGHQIFTPDTGSRLIPIPVIEGMKIYTATAVITVSQDVDDPQNMPHASMLQVHRQFPRGVSVALYPMTNHNDKYVAVFTCATRQICRALCGRSSCPSIGSSKLPSTIPMAFIYTWIIDEQTHIFEQEYDHATARNFRTGNKYLVQGKEHTRLLVQEFAAEQGKDKNHNQKLKTGINKSFLQTKPQSHSHSPSQTSPIFKSNTSSFQQTKFPKPSSYKTQESMKNKPLRLRGGARPEIEELTIEFNPRPSQTLNVKAVNLQGINKQTAQHSLFLYLKKHAKHEPIDILAVSETWMSGKQFQNWLIHHPLGNYYKRKVDETSDTRRKGKGTALLYRKSISHLISNPTTDLSLGGTITVLNINIE
jgi:hypothetical protein